MDLKNLPVDKLYILYDGHCLLCNRWVQFLLQHDPQDHFRFISQQSSLGELVLQHIGYSTLSIDSIVVYQPNLAYYVKSEAVFRICQKGDYVLKLVLGFQVFPKPLLDYIYQIVAKKRYEWFGKLQACPLPHPSCSHKFLG
jgi:predicted DCC family thiol-disulfide oxidoreductase YuxK